jgi:hypothetical protein
MPLLGTSPAVFKFGGVASPGSVTAGLLATAVTDNGGDDDPSCADSVAGSERIFRSSGGATARFERISVNNVAAFRSC